MNTYLKEISRSMKMLSKNKKTIFIGQSVKYSGSSIYVSLKNVPNQKKIELPVFEETQLLEHFWQFLGPIFCQNVKKQQVFIRISQHFGCYFA